MPIIQPIEEHYINARRKLEQIMDSVPLWFRNPSNNIWLDKSSAINSIISLFSSINGVCTGLGIEDTVDFNVDYIEEIKRIFSGTGLEDWERRERLVFLIAECNSKFDEQCGKCYAKIMELLKEV